MKLDAGKLDRRLSILNKTTVRDAVGQPVDTWTALATVAAQRLNLSTVDIARQAGREGVAQAKYLIRYRSDLSVALRCVVDGLTYNIIAVDEPDRRATLILTLEGVL